MLELIRPLTEKVVELLREGERKRGLFFSEVVVPVHAKYLELKANHERTFEEARTMVTSPGTDLPEIYQMVVNRSVSEAHLWKLFMLLSPNTRASRQTSVQAAFQSYLSSLNDCTERVEWDGQVGNQKLVYITLAGAVGNTSLVTHVLHGESERDIRNSTMHGINEVQGIFSDYCAEVEAKYLDLQALCKL